MKILIIGKGGREHAIAWKIKQSPLVSEIFIAPGNDGMKAQFNCIPIGESHTDQLLEFALKNKVDLTIVGPEAVLMNGLVDQFQQHGLTLFSPIKGAAMVEGSKDFAKRLMQKYGIPTAQYATFSDYDEAKAYLDRVGAPIVIKYDGIAAGKGVVVASTIEVAEQALKEMLLDRKFGDGEVIIEQFLEGPEFSLMALVHGEKVVPLVVAQDHKRAYDGDQGPNTGGMGAYTPVPLISESVVQDAVEKIMKPMAQAMVQEGIPFTGVLYGGLILTSSGPQVIEFNARFGDPETEVILPKMKSDLVEIILELLKGRTPEIEWDSRFYLGVVLASKGYPGSFTKGEKIQGLEKVTNPLFHMGTEFKDGKWCNSGGRVLLIVGKGETIETAQQDAYRGVAQINAPSLFYRTDIGYQAMKT
ncbi:MAG: phosphoribosylamine--glycine ligase [Bacteroidales bacterium]|jgi:phosphoribosylamine--glycine ligase